MRAASRDQDRKAIAKQAYGTVLEIGFGSGLNLPFYNADRIKKLYALEPSAELFELAKDCIIVSRAKGISDIEFIQAGAEAIPLPDHSIDTVISTWTMCSIPRPDLALKEILRVLKVDGKFIFIEHGKSPKSFWAKCQHLLTPFSKKICGNCHLDRPIADIIKRAGFEIELMETSAHIWKPLGYTYKGSARIGRSG